MAGKKSTDADFDLIVRGGTVYEGTMADPVTVDIGVNGDKIEFVGEILGKAATTINAAGYIVTPGFIDVHTHCDMTFLSLEGQLEQIDSFPGVKGNLNYLYQGVTTVVSGNCGLGYGDINSWFDMLDHLEFGTNVYHLASHGSIRKEAFGENQPGELNSRQLETMIRRVSEEMEKGAVGFSTGLEYAPGLMATNKELIELNKVVRKHNRIYTTHMRSESGAADAEGITGIERAFNETMAVVRAAEVPVEISHLKITAPTNNQRASLVLNLIEKARAEGLKVTADQYPYDAGSSHLAIELPDHLKSDTGIKDEFKAPEYRDELKRSITDMFQFLGPEKILITIYGEKTAYEGKTVREIADIEGGDPADSYADMLCEQRSPFAVFFSQDMKIVEAIMPNDYIITGSDGWTVPMGLTSPHPRTYGTFPGKIRKHVLDQKLMDLKQAIYSMTGLPAETFNMKGRGKITPGAHADIAIIDLDTIDTASTYLDPHHYAEGVVHLLVNGTVTIENGKATGVEAGKCLRM